MILGHLVEVMHVELALVFDLRVVEEISCDPGPRRRLRAFARSLSTMLSMVTNSTTYGLPTITSYSRTLPGA